MSFESSRPTPTGAAAVLAIGLLLSLVEPADAQPQDQPALLRAARELSGASKWAEAAVAWQQVVNINPHLGEAWQSLGTARYQAGQYREAIPAFERALELRAGYPWDMSYNIARCHAVLREKEQALTWLKKSFADGYRRLHEARDHADFMSLHDEPRFCELVAKVDTSTFSRDQGWRYDLQLLVRELKRIHYDLSKKPAPAGFDALARNLHDTIPVLSDTQVEASFMKLAALAGDAHTTFAFFLRNRHQAVPVQFYLFAEGLFVIAAASKYTDLADAQVLQFGDQPVDKVLTALEPVISRDNQIWLKHMSPLLMRYPAILNGLDLIPKSNEMTLTVRDASGRERQVTLTAEARTPPNDWTSARDPVIRPMYLKNRQAAYWFEYQPATRTVYFQYNAVRNDPGESLEQFCGRLFAFVDDSAVDRLVIDMRWNDGGNNFLNRPLVHGLIRNTKVNQPGKLFVIIGRNTFSAAMCGATEIERRTSAVFVGEPTGSSPNFVGEMVMLNLPYSKLVASISDLYWQNSVAMDYRAWIAPAVYTPPTFADFRANRDPALEAILAYRAQ